ncbi:VF530 family DNA-binding protein [Sedimenticola selenatireducens]|uniref:DNA-binding protein VF530 n=1 Tax=Sedimenticola selenatireducens TaxID=191960 RepID=A0A557SJZ2_9GAMM|nr:VF530 family DNA-binding protein [Sedimenticola selenatireducens]TVO77746.1 DNA-binding protein VF530 [Sedimenticola selenatireducens]TVT65051.1 MAG: DNA-binding protein VF530 [Sedimenticola selenatireducens]
MNDEIDYTNNPLHGVSLKKLLTEMVDHYGFDILYAYLNVNCFKTNPSIESSMKFLKKTEWAREKVEAFYLYKFKNLPRASAEQFELSPRDRIVPEGQTPGEPAELSLEEAEMLREKRAKQSAERGQGAGDRTGSGNHYRIKRSDGHSNHRAGDGSRKEGRESSNSSGSSVSSDIDPWAKWRK